MINNKFQEWKLFVEQRIQDYFSLVPGSIDPRLWKAMAYAMTRPAKRLRALLVMAVADLWSVPPQHAVSAALAIEMVHNYSLIHDDLPMMDDDDTRRGEPSCHKQYGEAIALLAGNGLQSEAFHLLTDPLTDPDPKVRLELVRILSYASGPHGMLSGQSHELGLVGECTPEALQNLQHQKTALLFMAACQMGCLLGRASLQETRCLEHYGRFFGYAFQLLDDIEDLEKDRANNQPNAVLLLGETVVLSQIHSLLVEAVGMLETLPRSDTLKKLAWNLHSKLSDA
jgi:farnesyl diphosphate synthase